ncbi:Sulfotransferase domain [Macleaya cordata]|uniref:Sulfotransferase n=1 Tax=Macleaya cordata TaxID=56857 RepID=A0A200R721_MACCD|nr:Sulfotransferase domain [Macleaya cordata]
MATFQQAPNGRGSNIEEEEELINTVCLESQQLLLSLPKGGHSWGFGYQYQGFWCRGERLQSLMAFQRHFQALDTDLIIFTVPRSGTLWLKSMAFAIVNRRLYTTTSKHNPLLTTSSHELVPFMELNDKLYGSNNCLPDFTNFHSPRLLATHVLYSSLPESIKNSNCKIVYICRNTKDNFISLWHFLRKWASRKGVDRLIPLDEALDLYCNGVSPYGPFWDHELGYWKESLERPKKVLFLKYEDMKKDSSKSKLKRLAEFLGYPFSLEEESERVMEEILNLCSFDYLKNLEVNKERNFR